MISKVKLLLHVKVIRVQAMLANVDLAHVLRCAQVN